MGTRRTPLSTREPGGRAVFFLTPDFGPESDFAPESGGTPSFTSDFDDEPSFLMPLSLAGLNVDPSSITRCTSLSDRRGPLLGALGVLLGPGKMSPPMSTWPLPPSGIGKSKTLDSS